jgi:putative tryptophan/tyrosine transport system substrate-binding protein
VRRREFIGLLCGAAVTRPLVAAMPAAAQQPAKVPRVGVLTPAESDATPIFDAFRKGLRDLGYVEGQTIILDFRLAKGNSNVRIPADVIVTDTTNATIAAASATRTIPIVMAASGGDPLALGLASSLARPGGNVTGMLFLTDLNAKRLQLLKLAFPGIGRVAVLFNQTSAIGIPGLQATEDAASVLGIRIAPLAANTPDELHALGPASLSGVDGLIVLPDGMFWNNRETIVRLASVARSPGMYPEREYADDGGLIAYGANVPDHFRQAAGYVGQILRGAKPGDLPINASSKFDFVVNLKTARALGLSLSPDFLSAANEVIE